MKEEKKEIQIENTTENPKSSQDSKITHEIKNKKNIFDISKFEQKKDRRKA